MRAGLVGFVLALTSGVLAAPAPQRVTWADWVGTYDGKLAWSNCTAPGAKSAKLALDATDAVLSIDLAPAGAAFRTMSLVEDETGWSAQQGDVKVHVARTRPDTAELIVELDSGCTMKGTLRRATTSVPACDRLLGWARVESRCTKQPVADAKLEDLGKLVATKWRKADAERCTARADKLEASLVDAGCAPHPDPLIGVRAPKCMELSRVSAKLARCANLPPQIRDAITSQAAALSSASQSAEPATLPYVEQQCQDVKTTIAGVATRFNCPI